MIHRPGNPCDDWRRTVQQLEKDQVYYEAQLGKAINPPDRDAWISAIQTANDEIAGILAQMAAAGCNELSAPEPPSPVRRLTPHIHGHPKFAVILCNFKDLPPLTISPTVFAEFVAGAGKGGVFDYWKDISYGTVDLSWSEVLGPYTMQYSYVHDGDLKRGAWISEAKRLASEAGVDLSPFYGVIAVVNSNPDDSNEGRDLALGISEWGDGRWRYCHRCQGLALPESPGGVCPAGGAHILSPSYNYTLAVDMPEFPGEDMWRGCVKCQGLAYAGAGVSGPCPAGGLHDHTGSPDYTLAFGDVHFQGQNLWKRCINCRGLSYTGASSPGPCPAGGHHVHTGSPDYTLAAPVYAWYYQSHLNVSFAAHEMGHCFELQHAHCAYKTDDYCDPWDIMGAAMTFYDRMLRFAPVGPGLNAGNLSRFGWIPEERIYTAESPATSIQLAALSQPEADGYLMARQVTPGTIYTVEYRQRNRWDRGLGSDAIVVHELKTPYTLGQNNWRWCRNCQGLAYAGFDPGACPASPGAVHDYTGSGDYSVLVENSLIDAFGSFTGEGNWKGCKNCQGLVFAGAGPGFCPAGGNHALSDSLDHTLIIGATTISGQSQWKRCVNCQGLAFAGGTAPGPCPDPSHPVHDHTGSSDYTLLHFRADEPFLLGSLEPGDRLDETGLHLVVESLNPAAFTATITI